jgi:molybdopterin-guanine dinucleotide biosynthesis protein A
MVAESIDGYVLAGGSSRRMGADKLFLQVDGKSLLERMVDVCERCFNRVKLVAGESEKLLSLNREVVQDNPVAKGPLAGIIAAIEDCRSDCCFITAADLVDLNAEMIESLVSQYKGQQYLGFMESGGLQPLCGIYHRSSLENLYECAKRGIFRMSEVVKILDHAGFALPSIRWRNINYPEDLAVGAHDD